MTRQSSQKGFALLEVVMVIIILGIIAFAAWRVIEATGTVDDVANQTNNSSTAVDSVPVAKNSDDLDKLKSMLDEVDVDDGTVAELETQTAF